MPKARALQRDRVSLIYVPHFLSILQINTLRLHTHHSLADLYLGYIFPCSKNLLLRCIKYYFAPKYMILYADISRLSHGCVFDGNPQWRQRVNKIGWIFHLSLVIWIQPRPTCKRLLCTVCLKLSFMPILTISNGTKFK